MHDVPKLRYYQEELKEKLLLSIKQGHKGICAVSPTGSGKSPLQGDMICDFVANGKQCLLIVHREELVKQLSLMLGRFNMPHQIIAAKSTVQQAKHDHLAAFGRCFIDPFADGVFVCSVQTLAKQMHKLKLNPDVIFQDEGHHLTEGSYWGRVRENYHKAIVLAFTASPERLDGKGLGIGHGGYCSEIVMGPYVDDLIDQGYLSEYVAFVPPEPINVRGLKETKSGSLSKRDQEEFMATKSERVMADALRHYQENCPNQPMVVYCATVKASEIMAEQFLEAGFKACAVNGNTQSAERNRSVAGLGDGSVEVLCNAEILGEGVDVPALTAVALCRPTQSLALHIQQIGRPLRKHDSKPLAYIFDCVGNIQNLDHFPCTRRDWSLEGKKGRKKAGDSHVMKIRTCPECFATHHMAATCPNCGHVYTTAETEIQRIEMELKAITPEELKRMREEQRQGELDQRRQDQNAMMREAKTPAELAAIDAQLGMARGATAHKQRAIEEKREAVATLGKALRHWKEQCMWGDVWKHDEVFPMLFDCTEKEARRYGAVRMNRVIEKIRSVYKWCRDQGGDYKLYEIDWNEVKKEVLGDEG